ncbi:c-type cytochrome [Mesorhizobium sp. M1227]|uniref:c-type cytochrome n=1 Tax=unclassified Mesorhizobium TaxID=325217 RepID=UPI003335BA79
MSHPLALALVIFAAIVSSAQAEGNADHGKTLFSRCTGCHAATAQNKFGPGLAGVFGRQAGTAPNFRYSKAMIGYARHWDDQTLENFLAAPAKAIPGTTMTTTVPNGSDRADIIAYLKSIRSP